jgi:hypothetical protein
MRAAQERAMNTNPKWWNEEHTSAWDRVKAALKRDWEQTKSDFHAGGKDLDQDVDDTVKQAAGKAPIPPTNQPNDWDKVEPEHRYGVGARHHYNEDWNDRLESKLKEEWSDLRSGRTWDEVKSVVKRGWDRGK